MAFNSLRLSRLMPLITAMHLLLIGPSCAQSSSKAEQDEMARDALQWIKAAIDHNARANRNLAYRKVKVKLLSCSVGYKLLMKRPGATSLELRAFADGVFVFSYVAAALPGTDEEFKSDTRVAMQTFSETMKTERAVFQFLRTCRDFSNPDTVHAAVLDTIM